LKPKSPPYRGVKRAVTNLLGRLGTTRHCCAPRRLIARSFEMRWTVPVPMPRPGRRRARGPLNVISHRWTWRGASRFIGPLTKHAETSAPSPRQGSTIPPPLQSHPAPRACSRARRACSRSRWRASDMRASSFHSVPQSSACTAIASIDFK